MYVCNLIYCTYLYRVTVFCPIKKMIEFWQFGIYEYILYFIFLLQKNVTVKAECYRRSECSDFLEDRLFWKTAQNAGKVWAVVVRARVAESGDLQRPVWIGADVPALGQTTRRQSSDQCNPEDYQDTSVFWGNAAEQFGDQFGDGSQQLESKSSSSSRSRKADEDPKLGSQERQQRTVGEFSKAIEIFTQISSQKEQEWQRWTPIQVSPSSVQIIFDVCTHTPVGKWIILILLRGWLD